MWPEIADCVQGRFLGRDGIQHNPESLKPTLIEGAEFRAVAAGRNAAAAVALNGSLFTWGSSALGRPDSGSSPGLVQGLEGHSIVKACMGEYHGVAIDDTGKAFVWGSMIDHHGELDGLQGINPQHTAAPLKGLPDCTAVTAVACGHEHTVLITQENQQSCDSNADVPNTEETTQDVDTTTPSEEKVVVPAVDTTPPVEEVVPAVDTTPPVEYIASDAIDSAARAASELLRGASSSQNPDQVETLVADTQPALIESVRDPELPAAFKVEECQNGAPRPAWIDSCDSVPSDIPELDRAWYGRYKAPTLDVVRTCLPASSYTEYMRCMPEFAL